MVKNPRYRTGFRRQSLIEARESMGWSRSRLAEALGAAKGTVEWWEYGYCKPSRRFRKKLAQIFHLCDWLDDENEIEEYVDAFLELTPQKAGEGVR